MGRQKVWHLGILLKKNLMANERKREHVEEQSCQCWLDQIQMQNRHRLRCCSAQVCVDLDLCPQRKTLFSPTQFKQHATTQARLAHGEGICNTIDSLYLEIVCNRARSKRATNQQEKCCWACGIGVCRDDNRPRRKIRLSPWQCGLCVVQQPQAQTIIMVHLTK